MNLKITNIIKNANNNNTIYWTLNGHYTCPYSKICDIPITSLYGNPCHTTSPRPTLYYNLECSHNKVNSTCHTYTGTFNILQKGYYTLYVDVDLPIGLKPYDLKIIIYKGLFVYAVGNTFKTDYAELNYFPLDPGDTLKFTVRSTLNEIPLSWEDSNK